MLKRPINYEDFDGKQTQDDFYFNLTQTELMEMELDYGDSLGEALQKIVDTQDSRLIYNEFKKLILAAFGEKSADGKRHVKSPEISLGFTQTAAFDALIVEFFENQDTLVAFIKGILPKKIVDQIDAVTAERLANEIQTSTPALPPPPPVVVLDPAPAV